MLSVAAAALERGQGASGGERRGGRAPSTPWREGIVGKCGRGAHLQGALRASRATFGMEGCCGSDAHNSSWACAPPESTDSRCCNPFSGPGGFPRSLLRRGSATFTSSTCGPSGHFLDPPGLSMGAGAVAGEFRALALAAVVAAAVATIFRVVMTCHQRPLYLPTL